MKNIRPQPLLVALVAAAPILLATPAAQAAAPSVTTLPATGITTTSATLNGTVNPNGESTTAYFQYGLDTDYASGTFETSLPATSGNLTVSNYVNEVGYFGTPGTNWTARDSDRKWRSVASSADGTKLVAAASDGRLYTSTDSGTNSTAREDIRSWYSVASSADGTKLVAAVANGYIYTSTNGGVSWTERQTYGTWESVASSENGRKPVALDLYYGKIYTSIDSGVNWTMQTRPRPISNTAWTPATATRVWPPACPQPPTICRS